MHSMSELDISFSERRAYKQCVLHRRCPLYGDPKSDKSRRIIFVERVSRFLRCGLRQIYFDHFFGLPEFLTVLFSVCCMSWYTVSNLSPAASVSDPTGHYDESSASANWDMGDKSAELGIPVFFICAICTLLQMGHSCRDDTKYKKILDEQVKDALLQFGETQNVANSASSTSNERFRQQIQSGKLQNNQQSHINTLFSQFACRAMLRNVDTTGGWENLFPKRFDNAGFAIRNHSGFQCLRFVLIAVLVFSIGQISVSSIYANQLHVASTQQPTKDSGLVGTDPNLCLGNEIIVYRKTETSQGFHFCAQDGFQHAIPVGASADKFVFYVVAIMFLLSGPLVQISWRLLSILADFPTFNELSIITVDTQLSSSSTIKGGSFFPKFVKCIPELLSLAYDPCATPLREQSYDDLYVKIDINKRDERNKLYGYLHADDAIREKPRAGNSYHWAYTSEFIDANEICIQDGIIVGIPTDPGNLWKFQALKFGNAMINHSAQPWSQSVSTDLRDKLVGKSIIKIIFYKQGVPRKKIDFTHNAFQSSNQGRLKHEQEYRLEMFKIINGLSKERWSGIAFQTQQAVFKHPDGEVDTFFPWCSVCTDNDTKIATYRARVTNVIAVVCVRLFLAIAFFICSAFGKLPWPLSNRQASPSKYKVIELNADVLEEQKGPPSLFSGFSVKSASGAIYGSNGYNGTLNTSPSLMLLYLGFYFTFQTVWLVASTMLHRLVVMELGYRQLMSNTDPQKIQEDVDGGEPAEYWCRFTKYGKHARKKRITDLTPSYLILGVCIVGIIISATNKSPDWLGVSIAGVAIAVTLFYMFLNLMVFRETLSLKTRRAIYQERGLNEQIEEMSREGEEDILDDGENKEEAKNLGLLEKRKLVF